MQYLTTRKKFNILKKISIANLSKTEFYELSEEIDKMDLVKIEALANKKLCKTFDIGDGITKSIIKTLMKDPMHCIKG